MTPQELAHQPLGPDGSFLLHLAFRNVTLQVTTEQSPLLALQKAGIDLPYSCGEGICGTCLTPVLAGRPEHWDSYQTPEEQASNSHIALCCSRSQTACLILAL